MSVNEEKIACPKCSWEPDGHAYWTCSCGISWNTFETYGKCPGCGKIWRDTQCPECAKWSPHVDWYVDLPAIELEKVEKATIAQT
ncbi:hypothetical protein Q0590_17840 [Rhodocytophaga aerolata]|uniref:Uncharacterized protein n=1 Tax=Rhodocytophaga aerolata TaxID=455078 RepID=A0ABT8R7R1_9BACT|nr:hypothetical protein [Rhodocytophaga aerolata]MDO1448141.1 hypothetical protein [Rhodocytophaga aerolata]